MDAPAVYDTQELVRPLENWEISRDHLVFAEIRGLDTGKRHIIHFLESRKDGEHGGVILTAAGNTVQILTLAPFVAGVKSQQAAPVLARRYLFGFGGGGIGSLCVHPSRAYFAVGEKGVKPNITVYRYPSADVCCVLRHGAELSYSSVAFSQDGDKLASVGGAPDFMLTVWSWRQQLTILRAKAFGQDVFSVQFAPSDSGFLATSGVGHIRMWKMASTFTGLKLQGDLGKFGKSELSDVEAFCVLPDKKVLSGTERGVLLLWDGNFIKCEILTSRRHLPHAGAISVVDYDAAEAQIVTAGRDGAVKFWSFDAIDRADVPPDDAVALVPMKRQCQIAPQMDIRAVIKESRGRYLVQDGAGAVHLLALEDDAFYVELDYLPNETGRVTAVSCSPYEHLAASCGDDGSVRAWDYAGHGLICSAVTTSSRAPPVVGEGESSAFVPAAATAIVWVPNAAALVSDQVPVSRQVAVGFSDGLVRVLLIDLAKRAWVRANVFKPHRKRVTCLSYAASGGLFATASDDCTIFVFKIVPSAKSTKFSKYPPEYEPLGYQRVAGAVRALHWRADGAALLATLSNGAVVEYFVPEGGFQSLALSSPHGAADEGGGALVTESFELRLASRELTPFQRARPMTVKELETLEALNPTGNPQVEDKIRSNFQIQVAAASLQAWAALYASPDAIYVSCRPPFHGALFLCRHGASTPLSEFASEENAHIGGLAFSASRKFLLCGLTNGKFQLRSARKPHAFLTGEFHDCASSGSGSGGSVSAGGYVQLALSFDDSFVLSAGNDGNLSICRLHSDRLEIAARTLAERHENLLAQAALAGRQAMEQQTAQLDVLQKALADGKNSGDDALTAASNGLGNELTSLPSFHHAKAYARFVESRLGGAGDVRSVATDDESFRGVVQLASDPTSAEGLADAVSPLDSGVVPTGSLLGLLEVPDVANPGAAYTIEDARLKSEADAKATSTRSKQDRTRDVVAQMRRQLSELRALNASYPPESRLDHDEWEIDLDYGELLTKMGDAACDEVRKELAFATEREELLLMKLRETYVSPLAVELITLHAFESGLSVQSFRTMKMPVVLQKRLNEIHTSDAAGARRSTQKHQSIATVTAAATTALPSGDGAESPARGPVVRKPSVLHIMAKHVALGDEFRLKDEERKLLQRKSATSDLNAVDNTGFPPGAPTAVHAGGGGGSVHGFEARKRLRADRKERLTSWLSSKPGEDADDPRDVVAIAYAQRNMGDYKLKSAASYVVPEEQRVNAAKKRRQMALLEEKLYEARLGFNAKLLELRELKLLLITELKQDQARLESLYRALGSNTQAAPAATTPEVDLAEWPEQRERVSDADVEVFLREKRVQPHSLAATFLQTPRGRTGSISSRRGSSSSSSEDRGAGPRRDSVIDRSILSLSRKLGAAGPPASAPLSTLYVRHLCVDELSAAKPALSAVAGLVRGRDTKPTPQRNPLDLDATAVRAHLVRQEIRKIERKSADERGAFDAAVAHLRREKMKLEVVFKTCELRLFTLLSELALLEQFESKENLLSAKLEKSRGEKAQVVAEMSEIQEILGAKRRELEEWGRQEKAVQSEFLATVNGGSGAPHPSFAALHKLFKKKIKRPKKKSAAAAGAAKDSKDGGDSSGDPSRAADNEGGNDEDDDEVDDEDDDEYDENDDDDDDDDEDDICPAGCDLQLYEKVLAVREKRADVDDAMAELAKAMEELRKSNDRQAAKQRQVDKELQATEQDIQQFQSEKQTRFNQLDVVVALSKHQVRCLESGAARWAVPEQATSCLVFTLPAFERLSERIESLQRENRSLRQQFRDLHKQQNVLAKDKKVRQETIAEIQHRCEQLQLLKFGQLVDIDVLDRACDTSKLGELQAKVRVKEIAGEREAGKVKQAQQELKREILRATERNTALLTRLAELNERQFALEKELNQASSSQSVLHDDSALLEQEMRERNKLVKLVKLQAREVEALKQEIGLLRGKDGK
ncbi:hypothetical protein PybrP1_000869, partial [[Pythium] brassicae (nom. inval.)]